MRYYLSLDIGGTYIKQAIVDEKGNILKRTKSKTDRDSLENLLKLIERNLANAPVLIEGISLSIPGIIDSSLGVAHSGGSLRYIKETPLEELISQRFRIPVTIENDGNCAVYAEKWLGNLINCDSAIVIVFGTGIGGGILLDNELHKGHRNAAGEFSCMITNFLKPTMQNYWGTNDSTKSLLKKYKTFTNDGESISGEEFFDKVASKDLLANKIYNEFLTSVSSAIFTLQSILDVEKVLIGGGISAQHSLILEIEKAVKKRFQFYQDFPVHMPTIEACEFNNDANLIGAVKVHLEKYGN